MQVYWPKNHDEKTFPKYLVPGMTVDFLLKKRSYLVLKTGSSGIFIAKYLK